MSAASEFQDDPYNFIRHNLLSLSHSLFIPTAAQIDAFTNTVLVELRRDTNYTLTRNRNRKGAGKVMRFFGGESQRTKAADYYTIEPARGREGAFRAYILPYGANSATPMMLEQKARFMFTARMDGCTFAAGMPNASGGRSVVHANRENIVATLPAAASVAEKAQAQAAAQRGQVAAALGAGTSMLEPGGYRPTGTEAATLIGIRKGTKWEFWHQDHEMGCESRLISVSKLAA